jgi:hypothetical protein
VTTISNPFLVTTGLCGVQESGHQPAKCSVTVSVESGTAGSNVMRSAAAVDAENKNNTRASLFIVG